MDRWGRGGGHPSVACSLPFNQLSFSASTSLSQGDSQMRGESRTQPQSLAMGILYVCFYILLVNVIQHLVELCFFVLSSFCEPVSCPQVLERLVCSTHAFIKHLQRCKHQNLSSLLPLRPLSISSGPLIILLFKIIIDLISQRHPYSVLHKGVVCRPFIYELFLDNPESLSYALQHDLDCSQKQDLIIKRHAKKEYS